MENQNFGKSEVGLEHDLHEGNQVHAALSLLHEFEKNPQEALALVKREIERNASASSSDKLHLVVQSNGDVMVSDLGEKNGYYAGNVPVELRDQVLPRQQKAVEIPPSPAQHVEQIPPPVAPPAEALPPELPSPLPAPELVPAQADPQEQGPRHKGFPIHIPFPIDVGVRGGSFHLGLNLLGIAKGGIVLGQKNRAYVGSDSLNTEVSAGVDLNKKHIGPVVDWKVLGDTITTGQARVGITPGPSGGAFINGGANAYAFGKLVGVGASAGVELGNKVGPQADAYGYVGPAAVAADAYTNISKNGLRAGANGELTAEPYAGLYTGTRVGLGKTNEAHGHLGINVGDDGAVVGAGLYPQFHPGVYAQGYSGSHEVGVDWTEQKDKAAEDRSRAFPAFADLTSAYDGPVLLATIDGTLIDTSDTGRARGNNGEPIFGAPGLLSKVEEQGIPIIYLSNNASVLAGLPAGSLVAPEQLPALSKQLPHAQFFGLGNDAGSDAALFVQNGVRPYLLNTEATQKNVPAGFQGILSDNFTPRFNERLLSDLQEAKTHQPPSPPSTWVGPPPIPASTKRSLKTSIEFVAGTPLYIAAHAVSDLIQPADKPATPAPGDWAGFEKFMDQVTKTVARPGSRVEPLIDGDKAFRAMFDAIDEAKSSVNYTVFQFASDETGWEMARHLAAAADRGCAVRLVYDQTGSALSNGSPTDPGIYEFLRKHGVEVREQPTRTLHITHRKIMVLDGSTGFIGGMNCADEYHETWHDVYSRVCGPAVGDLQDLFKEQWQRNGGSMPDSPPPAPIAGAGTARVVSHKGHLDEFLKQSYLAAIDTADDTIRIADPYFSDSDLAKHLEAAARRGVHVQLVFPHTNDNATLQHVERSMYPALLAAGIEVYEYSGRPMAHEKVATFDGRVSTIGSSNLDDLSMIYNDEANIWSMDPKTVQIMDHDVFDADIRQSIRIRSYVPTLQDEPARLRRLIK